MSRDYRNSRVLRTYDEPEDCAVQPPLNKPFNKTMATKFLLPSSQLVTTSRLAEFQGRQRNENPNSQKNQEKSQRKTSPGSLRMQVEEESQSYFRPKLTGPYEIIEATQPFIQLSPREREESRRFLTESFRRFLAAQSIRMKRLLIGY
jgi:hypothetical protein